MNYNTQRIFVCISEIIVGGIVALLAVTGKIDSSWANMGGVFAVVGAVLLVKHLCVHFNTRYREKQTTALQDERNRFLGMKAWSWAGYLYLMAAAVTTIIFRIIDRPELSTFAGLSVCAILAFYWISRLFLRMKY